MAQEDVYQWLKRRKSWHTVTEISNGLNFVNRQSITVNCYKLRKFGFVDCRKRKQRIKGKPNELEYRVRG